MKFKSFESLLQNCKNLYDTAQAQDKKIQDALGGDSQVMTAWWESTITETLRIIEVDMNDKHGFVNWLFWENICNQGDQSGDGGNGDSSDNYSSFSSFWKDDIEYIGNPRNVWLELKGKLNEDFSTNSTNSTNPTNPTNPV